jgi:hypothetical protein
MEVQVAAVLIQDLVALELTIQVRPSKVFLVVVQMEPLVIVLVEVVEQEVRGNLVEDLAIHHLLMEV